MNIHEYQAKALLREFGVAVPRGVAILKASDADIATDELGGPVWVVKSQIHAGGRGKGKFKEASAGDKGGVRIAKSVAEVNQFVKQMLGATLVTEQTGPAGKQVNRLYIEEGSEIDKEFYLSILVDRETSRVAFVVSTEGGVNIEDVAHNNRRRRSSPSRSIPPPASWAITAAPSPRRWASAATSPSRPRSWWRSSIPPLSPRTWRCWKSIRWSSPRHGDLRVLDAKVSFDDNALYRHPEVVALRDETEEDAKEIEASKYDLNYITLDGTIGCMVNGAGLAMATMDIIKLYGMAPANFLDVGGGADKAKVTAAFKIITADPNVKGILINIFGGIMKCDIIAEGVVAAVKDVGLKVPLVVRLEGTNVEAGKKIIADSGLNVLTGDNLDDSAQKIVKAVKGG